MWLEPTHLRDFFLIGKVIGLFSSRLIGILFILSSIIAALITYCLLRDSPMSKKLLQKCHLESWHFDYLSTLTCFFWIGASLYSLLVISYFFKPVYHLRYVLPAMVPCAILISAVICNMRRSVQILIVALILMSYIHQIKDQLGYESKDYPKVVSYLRQANHDKGLVYVIYGGRENFVSPVEFGLHYYGYNEPNISLLSFVNHEIREPRLLETNEHYFIVVFDYESKVEGYLKRLSRRYKKIRFGLLHLFEVDKMDHKMEKT
jgi:hypothetical protein